VNKYSTASEKDLDVKVIDRVDPSADQNLRIHQDVTPERNEWVRQYRIREEPVSDDHVDIIIPWHCENNDWIKEIIPEISSMSTIVFLLKADPSDLSKPECSPDLSETSDIETFYIILPKKGPDIQSLFSFISNNYNNLATYTMFLPTDYPWEMSEESMTPSTAKNVSHAASINTAVPLALHSDDHSNMTFLPMMPDTNNEFIDHRTSILSGLIHTNLKIYDRVNAAYKHLFQSNTYSQEEYPYVPTIQFLVHRDEILNRPLNVWENIEDICLECYNFGTSMVFLIPNLFNPTEKMTQFIFWDILLRECN